MLGWWIFYALSSHFLLVKLFLLYQNWITTSGDGNFGLNVQLRTWFSQSLAFHYSCLLLWILMWLLWSCCRCYSLLLSILCCRSGYCCWYGWVSGGGGGCVFCLGVGLRAISCNNKGLWEGWCIENQLHEPTPFLLKLFYFMKKKNSKWG